MRLLAMLLLLPATPSTTPVLSPQLLVGERHIESGETYHFRADGTWSCHFADMIDGTLERPHGKSAHEIIAIDRIVHETLYVRTKYQREVWLTQPRP